MGDWLQHIALKAKSRTGFGPGLVACVLIATLSLAIALGFLCVALFVWLSNRYDAVAAGLILAGIFLLIAILAGVAGLLARLRNMERARRELAARSQASWLDPKFLAVGVEIGRAIGWRRIITLAAFGLFAAGLGKEWSETKKPEGRDPDA